MQLLVPLVLLWTLCDAAYVQTFRCGSGTTQPLTQSLLTSASSDSSTDSDVLVSPPTVEVMLKNNLLIYRLQFTAEQDTNDVNYTTNRYTTVNIKTTFIDGDVYEKSARLCDYLTVVQDSVYSGPPGGPIIPRNDTFTGDGSLSVIADLFDSQSATPAQNSSLTWIPGYTTTDEDDPKSQAVLPVCPMDRGTRYQILYVNKIGADRYFGSYDTRFTFVSADLENKNSDCFEVYVTPWHPNYITFPICFSVLAIFVFGLISTFYIYHYSPSQESSNVFLLIASSICNEPLLNELTPDVMSLFHYLQFSLFSVCLDITYPWFLPAIVSYLNWVALIRVDVFSSTFINPLSSDGVYQTLGRFGLFAIFPVKGRNPTGNAIAQIWGNFMIWICCCVVFFVILSHFSVFVSELKSKRSYPWRKSVHNSLAVCVQFFYQFFPLPFITISAFLLWALLTRQESLNVPAASFCLGFILLWIGIFLWFFVANIWRGGTRLYSSLKVITVWGSVYNYYKPDHAWFVFFDKFKVFFDGMVIGLSPRNGIVQLILLICSNIIYSFAIVYYQPFFNGRKNFWSLGLTIIQFVNLMLSITYIRNLGIKTSTRSIVGDVQLMIHAIVILVFLFFFVLRSVQVYLKTRHPYDYAWSDESGKETLSTRDVSKRESLDEIKEDPVLDTINRDRDVDVDDDEYKRGYEDYDEEALPLTDFRVLPGLSLSYAKKPGPERRPTAVSPITYEYLERIQNEDLEVKALWQNRLVRRRRTVEHSESWINRLKRSSTEVPRSERGFSVVGRRPIIAGSNTLVNGGLDENVEDANEKEDKKGEKEGGKNMKRGFSVVGRKPIMVKHDT